MTIIRSRANYFQQIISFHIDLSRVMTLCMLKYFITSFIIAKRIYLVFCSDDIISTIETEDTNITDHKLLKIYSNIMRQKHFEYWNIFSKISLLVKATNL